MSQRLLKANRSFSEVRSRKTRTRHLPRAVAGIRRVNDVARELVVLVACSCLIVILIVVAHSAIELDGAIADAITHKIKGNALPLWEWLIVVSGAVALCAALKHELARFLHDRRRPKRRNGRGRRT
jgi:hypothetical protein